MDPKDKNKKRRYEPPKIYELDVDMTQAMGASVCKSGSQAASTCSNGPQAKGACSNGNRAVTTCSGGSSGRTTVPCSMGGNPAT
jgi:hypothetical protein